MANALLVPMGTLTSLGIGKEANFGNIVSPTVWHSLKSFSPSSTNTVLPRTGARVRWGQSEPITGAFDVSAALTVESDPDTVPQLLAYGLGNQSAPTHNVVATTVATGGSTLGSSIIPITSTIGIQIGCSLSVDTAANIETVVVADITPTGILTVAPTTKAHIAGVVVTLTSATAYISTYNFGQLPSFTVELGTQTDVIQYSGIMVDSFALDLSAVAEIGASFNLIGAWQNIKGTAAVTPVYSVLKPYSTVSSQSNVIIANVSSGAIGEVGVMKIGINVANNLKKGYYSIGTGRRVLNYPQLQRKVTGTLSLGFETDAAFRAFFGAVAATGPQNDVPGVAINAQVVSPGVADTILGLNYALQVFVGNAKFTKFGMKVVSNDMITQDLSWEASETSNGANDDVKCVCTNQALAVY